MKKVTALLIALLLTALCLTPALAIEEGDYRWRDNPVEVTKAEKNPMLVPASINKDEYAIAVYMTVEESLWKNDALSAEMYADAQLADAAGNSYKPGAMMTGSDKPLLIFTFCVPKSVEADELSFVLGEEKASDEPASAAEKETPSGDGTATVTTASGDSLTLTPLKNGAFLEQSAKVTVHTRLGTTVHNSGSQFTAGSGLSLSTMKSTKQYNMPMAAFAYETKLGFDEAADAIGEIGAKTMLTLDGAEYPARVVWITEDMASLIFSCPELPSGTPRFSVKDGRLVIEP